MKTLITIREFCDQFGVGRTRVYELIRSGAIEAVKAGASTRITAESASRWAADLPRLGKNQGAGTD